MHKYLRAIGFSKYNKKRELRPLLDLVIQSSTASSLITEGDEVYGHISRAFGDRFGLRLYGEYGKGQAFEPEYCFPYADSDVVSTMVPCVVERHADKNSYGGMCEEPMIGVSLIFYLSNSLEYMRRVKSKQESSRITGVSLTGLCLDGKILLPLQKTARQRAISSNVSKNRSALMEAARKGDEKAMESLAMEDMNLVQQISNRIMEEDIYSLVDTCFMPYGLECDVYSVIGEILSWEIVRNHVSGEEMYRFLLNCNDMKLSVMINRMDLLGEPAVGRRFKGDIWLQGRAEFE